MKAGITLILLTLLASGCKVSTTTEITSADIFDPAERFSETSFSFTKKGTCDDATLQKDIRSALNLFSSSSNAKYLSCYTMLDNRVLKFSVRTHIPAMGEQSSYDIAVLRSNCLDMPEGAKDCVTISYSLQKSFKKTIERKFSNLAHRNTEFSFRIKNYRFDDLFITGRYPNSVFIDDKVSDKAIAIPGSWDADLTLSDTLRYATIRSNKVVDAFVAYTKE